MGRFRNKAIEAESRRVLYSPLKGAHCTGSVGPTGSPSSGLPLLPFPQLGLCLQAPQDALGQAALSSHFPVSAALGLSCTEEELGSEPPRTFLALWANSVVVGDESASFQESWEQTVSSQAAARRGHAGSKKTVGANNFFLFRTLH